MDLLLDSLFSVVFSVAVISIFVLRSKFQLEKLTKELRELQKEQEIQTEQIQHLQNEQRRLALQVAQFHIARINGRRQA